MINKFIKLMYLALYNFIIYYQKNKFNPANESTQHPDYMNKVEAPDISIIKLMPTLLNKLAIIAFRVNK